MNSALAQLARILSMIVKLCSILAGLAAYNNLVPERYLPWAVLVFAAVSCFKEVAIVILDYLDDGQRNFSYDPTKAAAWLLAGLALCLVPACALKPEQIAAVKQVVVPLSQIYLTGAVANGNVQPGDAIKIGNGIAIITSSETATEKAVKLSDIGLQAAVDHGKLREGDALLIRTTTAVVASLVTAPATPAAP